MVLIRKNRKAAICHPMREMRAHGLCASCYASYHRYNKEKFKNIVDAYKINKEKRIADSIVGREERAKQRRLNSPFKYKSYKTRYGLTEETYLKILENQNYCCKICLIKPEYDLLVDHCHATGKVRGMLCRKCNNLLGYLENTSDNLMSEAYKYLELESKSTFYSKAMTKGSMDDIEWV